MKCVEFKHLSKALHLLILSMPVHVSDNLYFEDGERGNSSPVFIRSLKRDNTGVAIGLEGPAVHIVCLRPCLREPKVNGILKD